MRTKQVVFLLLGVLLAVVISACGGGGGGETPPPVAQFSVNASKALALAGNTDTSVITAKFSGVIPPDGTPVTFSISGPGTFDDGTQSSTGVTVNGSAEKIVKSPAIGEVTITAASAGNTANTKVKFIDQPTSMKVSIALNPAVTDLANLGFSLVNSPGAAFNAGSETSVAGTFVAASQASSSDTTNVTLITATSFNTGTTPIIELTYTINSGLPTVQVTNISASRPDPSKPLDTLPLSLGAENFVITVDYNTD